MYSGKKPFRLGMTVPAQDGTAFYRSIGPLFRLLKTTGSDLIVEQSQSITWAYFAGIDALFMQRPFTADHVRIMKMAKANGCPVWVDYDDDLFAVPMQNPTFSTYSRKEVQSNVVNCLLQADVVSVSTPHLLKRYQETIEAVYRQTDTTIVPEEDRLRLRPEKFMVVPNAYDEKLFNYSFRAWDKPVEKPAPLLLWRGSATHDADMSAFTPEMHKAFAEHGKGWTMNFVGQPWWGTMHHLEKNGIEPDRILVTPSLDVIEYMHYIAAVKPSIMQVPLIDDMFNFSKSNIAWMEATHAGAITLAPAWEEWRVPGILNYQNKQQYYEILSLMLSGSIDRNALLRESRDYIAEHLTLSRVNRRREQIIETLQSIDPWA